MIAQDTEGCGPFPQVPLAVQGGKDPGDQQVGAVFNNGPGGGLAAAGTPSPALRA